MATAMVGLDAAAAAVLAEDLLAEGESLQSVWRYVVFQLLDDYSHDLVGAEADGRSSCSPPRYLAGLRFGELTELRRRELDIDHCTVRVRVPSAR